MFAVIKPISVEASFLFDMESSKKADFEKIAEGYDQFVDWASFGIQRIWKDMCAQRLNPSPGMHLLDVAGGTGEVAFCILKRLKKQPNPDRLTSRITVCDISEAMLNAGKRRAQKLGYTDDTINWVVGDAENLPVKSESVSACSISFGMKFIPHIDEALAEVYRVLKPGGRFVCIEFSRPKYQLIEKILNWYIRIAYFVMGLIFLGHGNVYQDFLVENREKLPTPEVFKSMIEEAGFSLVTYESVFFGLVAIHSGFK